MLADRPLSVIRVRPGQPPFMQKNLPKYTPDWVSRTAVWAEASHREVSYALVNDRRTLLWFANQRAVEYHATLFRLAHAHEPDFLVLDLDPPAGAGFDVVVAAAQLVRPALTELGLAGAVKTSGAKGVHVFVPLTPARHPRTSAAATRAIAARAERLDPSLATTAYVVEDRDGKVFLDSTRSGGATVVAAYSPRVRPGVPVSFPVAWEELDRSPRRTSPSAPPPRCSATAIRGARRCRSRSGYRPTWSTRARDPDRPGAGDARGKASGPSPTRRNRRLLSQP